MINVLIGIFYIALVALVSYLIYYIIKIAIKDAYYEIELKCNNDEINDLKNTKFDDEELWIITVLFNKKRKHKKIHNIIYKRW